LSPQPLATDGIDVAGRRVAARALEEKTPGTAQAGGGSGVSLSITTSTLTGGTVEISPAGEIDVENAYEIREAVAAQLTDDPPGRIELNMRHVSFIDSVGISALVGAFQLAGVSDVKLVVTHPSRFAHRQLWVTGLLGLFGSPEPSDDSVAPDSQPAVSGA
jgi:anti-anti-sigma factor